MRCALLLSVAALALLSACSSATDKPTADHSAAAVVMARAETQPVGTSNEDAADDPAIWRNAADPAASLIVATDKKAGLHVYGLDGKSRHFSPDGRLNNVDLIDLGPRGIVVVASDRNDEAAAVLRLYRLNTADATLTPLGQVSGGAGEAYGVCLARDGDALYAYSVLKSGAVHQIALTIGEGAATGRIVRTMTLKSQPEGCVVDERSQSLYVGEEVVGIWKFDARASGSTTGTLIAPADGKFLVADVEGLAIAADGADGGFLIASSQGDNAYAIYALPAVTPAGRFRIGKGQFGSTEETDGIALTLGDFGPQFPGGLFVAQDGENEPAAQNFKLVAWDDVSAALAR